MATMNNECLVTAEDIADRFGVTVGTVNRWVREGAIPYLRPSRRVVRFDLEAVERALAARAAEAAMASSKSPETP